MNQQTIEWLKEVRWRADKATKGLWKKMGTSWISYDSGKMFCVLDDEGFAGTEQAHVNSVFITHSHTDIPRLLFLLDEQQKEVERLRGALVDILSKSGVVGYKTMEDAELDSADTHRIAHTALQGEGVKGAR